VVDALVAQHFILDRERTYVLERCGLLWDALIH
jgi:hypothetical protein